MTVEPIRAELDRFAAAGGRVDLWWRDDDAVADGPALERLLALSRRTGVPVALAAISALVRPSLARRLADAPEAAVLVHGWRHVNHAPPGEKTAEFGAHRPRETMAGEAASGLARLREVLPGSVVPAFVPPWNRLDAALLPSLAASGFAAVSSFGDALSAPPPGSPAILNTHLDPVAWRTDRGLVPAPVLAASCARHLARATGAPSPTMVGLLTHHLVTEEAVWSFCERLLSMLRSHPAVRIRSIADIVRERSPGENLVASRDLMVRR